MIDMAIKGKPSSREEIRRALSAKAAFEGRSLATLAVHDLKIAPYILKALLNGVTSTTSHPTVIERINELTGADMAAWDK
jgi:hypothetical protein